MGVLVADRVHVDADRLRQHGDSRRTMAEGVRRLEQKQLFELIAGFFAQFVGHRRPRVLGAFDVTARLHQKPVPPMAVNEKVECSVQLPQYERAGGQVVLAGSGVQMRHLPSLPLRCRTGRWLWNNACMTVVRTERGLDRLVNFSDGTVAIAITLLILPLVDAAGDFARQDFSAFWADNFWELMAFAISFAVIANFWVVHHRIFEWAQSYNNRLIWINFLWLATIVFIPFTANVLSNSTGPRPEVYALYIGTLLVSSASMQAIALTIQRTPGLGREGALTGMDGVRGWATTLLLALCLVLAVLVPDIGMWWLLLLFLAEPVHRVLGAMTRGSSQTRE